MTDPGAKRGGSPAAAAPRTERLTSRSEEETRDAGRRLAGELERGDVVAFYGELGTGKTRFIQGICAGFGVISPVSSPTFTIIHEYETARGAIFHFDCYRIGSVGEALGTGIVDYIREERGVCLIEWAGVVLEFLPAARYDVRMAHGGGDAGGGTARDTERVIEITRPAR